MAKLNKYMVKQQTTICKTENRKIKTDKHEFYHKREENSCISERHADIACYKALGQVSFENININKKHCFRIAPCQ